MEEDRAILKEQVLTRILLLDAKICGIVTGLLCGVGLFLATNLLVLRGGVDVGKHLSLLGHYFPGYRVTFTGSLIGSAYAFIAGFSGGYFIARVYNWVVSLRNDTVQTRV